MNYLGASPRGIRRANAQGESGTAPRGGELNQKEIKFIKNKMVQSNFLNRRVAIKLHLFLIVLLIAFLNVSFGQSVHLDKRLGEENAKLVEDQMGLYPDKAMSDYVRAIGDKLVAQLDKNPFDFQFHIADDRVPNAFALPGGYVYVTRGLLTLITSEDELACVMAHEIIHVIKRHSVKQMRKSIIPHLLEVPGAIVGTVVSDNVGNLINAPIKTSNTLLLSSYSRKHEREADSYGIELAAKSGYNPFAMGDILDRLSRTVELLTDEKQKKSYFDSHPYTPDRVKSIEKISANLSPGKESKISEDFPSPIDGLVFGSNPKKGFFDENVFVHPDLNFTITFPDEWETTNQPTSVIAIHEDRQAGIFLGLEDPSKSPKEHAKEFEKAIKKEHKQKPSRSETRIVNNNEAYVISFEDNSDDVPMYIHILWLKMNGQLFKIIGFAPKTFETELKETAMSLRTLSSKEKKDIKVNLVRIVKARDNETLEDLGKRTNNILKTNLTALINDVEENSKLEKNQAVKIIIKEQYFK
jgi:predicted Zn-dependent protease